MKNQTAKRLCMCGREMEQRGIFFKCSVCEYVYKEEKPGAPLALVRIGNDKPTPAAVGCEWFAKIKAAL